MRALKRDPAPTKLAYRANRLWRSPRFRRFATVWTPLFACAAALGWAATKEDWRALAVERYEAALVDLNARPEFAIRRIEVAGASAEVEGVIRAILTELVGTSSLEADPEEIRVAVAAIGWVRDAKVRLDAPETLVVTVEERVAAAVWRRSGRLSLVDEAGAVITPLERRDERADLPVIAGAGAERAVGEAKAILSEAGPLAPRIRGLVRIGERRWDIVLADGPRVMLPATGAVDAVAYLRMIQTREDVAGKDLAAIDLRLMERPTLRLNEGALEALQDGRKPPKAAPGEKDA